MLIPFDRFPSRRGHYGFLRSYVTFVTVAALLAGFVGCGSRGKVVKLAPVSGIVRYNGKPLSGAYVKFMQEKCPIVAGGLTDEDGNFEITAFKPGDGAPIGENLVTITFAAQDTAHRREVDSEMEEVMTITDPEEQGQRLMELSHKAKNPLAKGRIEEQSKPKIPLKYAQPETSKLKFTVVEGEENLCQLDLEG